MDTEKTVVIFRAEKSDGEVTAVFPELPGTCEYDVTVYAHMGQHCTGTRGWYQETRPATDEESLPLRMELATIGYNLNVVKRWTARHDDTRRQNAWGIK